MSRLIEAQRPAKRVLMVAVTAGSALLVPGQLACQLDPSGSWETWRSEHFRVHVNAEQSHLADRVIAEAERAYELLASELVAPRGTIDLAVMDNVDFSNGIATVFPSNRLVIFLPQPATNVALSHYDDWLRVVLVHELTHVFHLDRARGVWGVLQRLFGRAPWTFPNSYRSSWVKEGVATYYESRFSTAGRVRGAQHTQLLNAAGFGARWPRSEDVTLASPQFPGGQRTYAWGSRFFELQTRMHGDSVVPRFVERSAAKLWPLTVASPLQEAGGTTVNAGWDSLQLEMPRPAEESRARVLVRGLRSSPNAVLAPDATELAYAREDGKRDFVVAVIGLDGKEHRSHRVNEGVRLHWFGEDIFVAQFQYRTGVTIRSQLYRWNAAGWSLIRHSERLTEAFTLPGGELAAIDVTDGHRSPVVVDPGGRHRALATPSPTDWSAIVTAGEWYAGVAFESGRRELYLWREGEHLSAKRVAVGDYLLADPAWTPDGKAVLFVSEATGLPQVYRYGLEGGDLTRITDEPLGAREPVMLPDGGLIFTSTYWDGFALAHLEASELSSLPAGTLAANPMPPVRAAGASRGGYNPWPALAPRYWNPILRSEGETGTFWGALTSGNDAIGRNAYLAVLAVAPAPGRLEGRISTVHQRWRGAWLDATLRQSWEGFNFFTPSGAIVPVGEREREGVLGLSLARRWWRSGMGLRLGGGLEQTTYFEESGDRPPLFEAPVFVSATASGNIWHRSRPALAISLENGVRLDALYRRRWGLRDGEWSYEVQGALSAYLGLDLPGFANWVLAAKANVGATGGTSPATLSIGGESGDPFLLAPGFQLGAGRRSFTMRGYPRIGGFDRAFVAVAELRVPIAMIAKGTWILPIVLDRVSATAFYEVGAGRYLRDVDRESDLQSAGAELAFDLGVLYDIATRVRFGGAVPLSDGLGVSKGDTRAYVAFGASF